MVAALLLLTRLPVGRRAAAPLREAVWAFPLVGAVLGGLGSLAFWAARALGLPPIVAAFWTLLALVLATGGLHEDGLADAADAFGARVSPARRLEIMRDSRIGSYGALALLFSIGMRAAAIAAIGRPGAVAAALVVTGAVARAAMLGPLAWLPPARTEGLAASLGAPSAPTLAVASGVAAVAAFALLPAGVAAGALALAALVAAAVSAIARRLVGGHTGDVLGVCEQAAECAVLSLLAAALAR
ncbi:MAG TPA: adenosylcobinamide-GDP ribazoletransferase [Acetobacteraceae bacterium]|nr:adenosylcobinamide-GDP ribazoletransferase [Acetobacteraceae bacterium]